MPALAVQVLQVLGELAVEHTIKALVGVIFDARTAATQSEPAPALTTGSAPPSSPGGAQIVAPSVPADPAQGGIVVMNAFLRALARGKRNTCIRLCEPHWIRRPETLALIEAALAAAPPVRWEFEELYTPTSWRPGRSLPWVLAELPVTYETDRGEVIVPTVLRAVQNQGVWQIDRLQWAEDPAPELDEVFAAFFADAQPAPERVVIDCPRCSRKLRVPGNKGRLRVTCPGCQNVQWYTP